MVQVVFLFADMYWTGNLGEATPDLSRALRCEKSKWWSFLRKYDRIGSIFGGIDSHAWRSETTRKHVLGLLLYFHIHERYIVSVRSNFLTQISHGTKTKCRKTRAMQRDSAIVDSLALRQLRHFCCSQCSLAEIAIPCTIYPSLNLVVLKNKS